MNKPIRILELEASKGWGGQEQRTVRLVTHLDKARFQIFWAVPPDSKLHERRESIPATFFPVKMRQSYSLPAILRLRRIVREREIDLIVTHSGKDGWLGAIVGKLTGVPVVRMRHLQNPISSPVSFNMSTAVVAVSRLVRDDLAARGVSESRLQVIYTGVDTDRFRPGDRSVLRAEIGAKDDEVLIGIVAVMREAKRHADLIEAVSRLPVKARLVIIGDGPQWDNLKKLVADKGVENRVTFLGHREDIPALLPGLDVFCLPSRMEALGTALLEAQACGVPAVGSKVGGIPECVAEGETGFLFPSGDIDALTAVLARLVDDEPLRRQLASRARERIVRDFSVRSMTESTEALYERLAKKTP